MTMLSPDQPTLHFPVSAEVPESTLHFELRALIYDFLVLAFGEVATIGCDQFVYWDPTDPRACLAPDAFVRFGAKDEHFDSWKVWERGAPQVAVEIISVSDSSQLSWAEKLERYRRLGVSELVRFDPETPEHPLRIWDFVGDDLLERGLLEPCAQSRHLAGFWLPVEDSSGDLTLRLSRDEQGQQLFPTRAEQSAARAEQNAARAEQNAAHAEQVEQALRLKTEALAAAEQRLAELEAELRRRS